MTVARQGLVDHADSLGATARFGGGDAQWMTAGRGIEHAEMFPLTRTDADNPLEMFQLWLNLPAADKMVPPHFTMFWNEQIPVHQVTDDHGRTATITIVVGIYCGQTPPPPPPQSWAAKPDSQVAIWTIVLDPGAQWTLPAASKGVHRSLYFFLGDGLAAEG